MFDPVKNFAKVIVSTIYDAAAVTIVLAAGEGAKLPAPATDGAFNLVWYNFTDYPDPSDDPNVEIVRVTARTIDTLTVTRAQEGTTASTKSEAGKTYKMLLGLTKKSADEVTYAAAVITDNAIVRGDGGAKGVQTSGVTIDDSNNMLFSHGKYVGTGTGADNSSLTFRTDNGGMCEFRGDFADFYGAYARFINAILECSHGVAISNGYGLDNYSDGATAEATIRKAGVVQFVNRFWSTFDRDARAYMDYTLSTTDPKGILGIKFSDDLNSSNITAVSIKNTGEVGIGITPTATLHLKAGTATAGTAPIKLTAGVNLTAPEAGAVEYDGTDLHFTNGAGRNKVAMKGLAGTKIYYVSDSSGGTVNRKLTFTDGILTSET
jgi:hypothetical protein